MQLSLQAYWWPLMSEFLIETRNLHFAYHDGKPVLNGVTFTVSKGESVGLIGPNGAGKSTLLMHLNGILTGQGTILIQGRKLDKSNLADVRRKVGWVAQDSDDQLFMPTLFDDVAFGPLNMGLDESEVRLRVEEALQTVGLEEATRRSPHHLSGGEKRAAAIATVLSMRPKVLLLDEPTNNLDHTGRRTLIRFLQKHPTTKIVASHDLEMILELCRRVILLDAGKVAADGPARKILANAPLLSRHRLEPPLSLVARARPDGQAPPTPPD